MADRDTFIHWLKEANERGATHVIVVCDTFDWSDYPVDVMPDQVAADEVKKLDGQDMQKVMECYDLSLSWDAQLNEHRAFHV